MNDSHPQPNTQQQADFIKQLKTTFEKMPHDIDLLLFTQKGKEDAFAEGTRQIVRAFRELTPRIRLREFGLDHEMAAKYQIEHSPTLLDRTRQIWHPLAGCAPGRGSQNISGDHFDGGLRHERFKRSVQKSH